MAKADNPWAGTVLTDAGSEDPGAKLPEVVADIVTIYEAIDHAVASRETKTAIQAVVDDLHGLAADVDAACAVQFYAHSIIAQIVSAHTDRTDTDQIGEILLHLAQAITIGIECAGVPPRSVNIARSNRGMWLGLVAEQLDPEDVEQVTANSEQAMRLVLEDAGEGTREQVIRACNLASHLLASGGDKPSTDEARELLEAQAGRSHLLGPESEADYFRQLGNAYRRTANYVDSEADATVHRSTAMDYYRQVEAVTPVGDSTTLYADIALLMSESGSNLDDVIATAQRGLDRTNTEDPYHREASLQLAEFYLKRYERDRNPADADHAETLSFNAVHSYYTRPGSFEQRGHLLRRLAVLEVTANRTGNRLDRYDEMLEIAERTGHDMSKDGMVGLAKTTTATHALGAYSRSEITFEALVRALTEHISHARFGGASDDRAARIADAVEHVADAIGRVQFAGGPIGELSDLIQDAHRAAAQAATERSSSRPNDEFYIAQARGHLALGQACAFGHNDVMAQAANLLAHAVAVGQQLKLSPSHMLPVLSIAHKAATFLNDQAAITNFSNALLDTIADLDHSLAANQTPESSVLRERLVAPEIGPLALNGHTSQETAWRIAFLRDTQTELSKTTWIENIEEVSATTTLIFIAQSLQACSAVVVANRRWTTIPIVDGSAQHFAPLLRQLAHASQSQADLEQRRSLLSSIMTTTKAAVADLAAALPEDRPVLLVDSGIMHWLPLAGALLELLPTIPGVSGVDRPTTSVRLPTETLLDSTAVLVAPGNELRDGPAYLPKALDDADAIQETIQGTEIHFEPDLTTTLEVVEQSTTAFFISHAEADIRSPLDSRLDLGEPFTARHALALTGDPLQLGVLASCESFSFDADVVEARFGIGTALLRTGTSAVIDCAWRVTDEVASAFTFALATALASGQSLISAFGTAIRAVPHASEHFQLRLSGIPGYDEDWCRILSSARCPGSTATPPSANTPSKTCSTTRPSARPPRTHRERRAYKRHDGLDLVALLCEYCLMAVSRFWDCRGPLCHDLVPDDQVQYVALADGERVPAHVIFPDGDPPRVPHLVHFGFALSSNPNDPVDIEQSTGLPAIRTATSAETRKHEDAVHIEQSPGLSAAIPNVER